MNKQYRTCAHCGANLDPGEHCDCPVSIVGRKFVGVDLGMSDDFCSRSNEEWEKHCAECIEITIQRELEKERKR